MHLIDCFIPLAGLPCNSFEGVDIGQGDILTFGTAREYPFVFLVDLLKRLNESMKHVSSTLINIHLLLNSMRLRLVNPLSRLQRRQYASNLEIFGSFHQQEKSSNCSTSHSNSLRLIINSSQTCARKGISVRVSLSRHLSLRTYTSAGI
jgi:hypothetical protein